MPEVASRVHDVVAAEFGFDRSALRFTDDLSADHGFDDLDLMRIAMRLEEEFGVQVSDDSLQRDRTIAKCVQLVRQGLILP
ncbi:acyl carrier protein [Sphingomonas sp. GCM10030256]|uniref:acyl carrier protein n=1 Tax=Sphingomonas sp. GCM10030256 TaxID=3273427 RepID=UPI00360C550B